MNVVAKLRQRGKKDQQPKLLCDIKCLKNVVTYFFFFFFLENAKNLGRSDDAKRRKKEGMTLDGIHCFSCQQSRTYPFANMIQKRNCLVIS